MSDIARFVATVLTLAIVGVGTYCAVTLVNVFARRSKQREALPFNPSEIEYLRDRVEQMDALSERVAELETRLDFAERLLTEPERHDTPAGSI